MSSEGPASTADRATTGAPLRLRLLSWNLHCVPTSRRISQRLVASAEAIANRRPDVVLLQEIWLAGQMDELEKLLSPDYLSVPLPDEGSGLRRSGLLSLVRRDGAWTVSSSDFTEFSRSAPRWRVWEGDGLGHKGIQRISLRCGDATAHLLNTHLQAEYDRGRPHLEIRRSQLDELSKLGRQLSQQSDGADIVIAAGDLNTDRMPDTERSPEVSTRELALYRSLLDVWSDLSEKSCSVPPCSTQYISRNERRGWIDYVLWLRSKRWQIIEHAAQQLLNEYRDFPYSDHEGLWVDLRMQPASRSLRGAALPLAMAALAQDVPMSRRACLCSCAALATGLACL